MCKYFIFDVFDISIMDKLDRSKLAGVQIFKKILVKFRRN